MPTRPASPPRMHSADDTAFMGRALRAARAAMRGGEVPVGAVVARGGTALASSGNRTIRDTDPSAHAEIVALRRAARALGNHRLAGAVLYVTLEPCAMCLGAILQARLSRVVYGAGDPKAGALWLLADQAFRRRSNHSVEVEGPIATAEAGGLLRAFFASRRGRAAPRWGGVAPGHPGRGPTPRKK